MSAGKGSKPRPVKMSVYNKNFDDIFRKNTKSIKTKPQKVN